MVLAPAASCGPDAEPERAFPKDVAGAVSDTAHPRTDPDTPAGGTVAPTPPGAAAPSAAAPAVPPPSPSGDASVQSSADSGWSVGIQSGSGSDRVATQRSVRVARNVGFDRIVIDLGADGMPGWHVEYVDTPVRQCGSGDEVRLAGDAWLSIRLEPARAHDDAGEVTVAERALRPQLPNVLELRLICDYEAHLEWVVGVRSPQPYRVLRLREPNRLVIDIRHPR